MRHIALISALLVSASLQAEDAFIYTPLPNYGEPSSVLRGDTVYPVIPGTGTPMYGSDKRMIIRDGKAYNVIPGTSTPNLGTAEWVW